MSPISPNRSSAVLLLETGVNSCRGSRFGVSEMSVLSVVIELGIVVVDGMWFTYVVGISFLAMGLEKSRLRLAGNGFFLTMFDAEI